jgi:DNA-binding beta-propeller fold protein YncE
MSIFHLESGLGPWIGEGRMRRVIAARRIAGRPITAPGWQVAGALAATPLAPSTAVAAGSVYVGSGAAGAELATFPIGAGGALSAQASGVSAGAFVFGVAVAPNGQELYTTDFNSGMVLVLSIAGGGTPILQTEVASGADASSFPDGIAVAPRPPTSCVASGQPRRRPCPDVAATPAPPS